LTNYFLTIVKPENYNKPWTDPPSHGFKSEILVQRFITGDKIVTYVANEGSIRYGFALVLEVQSWENKLKYKNIKYPHQSEFPWRIKVKIICEIDDPDRMPKLNNVWPHLEACRGMSPRRVAWWLHTNINQINEHDFNFISQAVCKAL
jgi:hypothetical protein